MEIELDLLALQPSEIDEWYFPKVICGPPCWAVTVSDCHCANKLCMACTFATRIPASRDVVAASSSPSLSEAALHWCNPDSGRPEGQTELSFLCTALTPGPC